MATQLTTDDARQSLNDHVATKGREIHEKYGPHIGWNELHRLLDDRVYVRYPCVLRFDSTALEAGQFAHPVPQGEKPEDGFTMYVHPYFQTQPDKVPHLVLYQLVLVNYGDFATEDAAEVFGASTLGISQEEYYTTLCGLADEIETVSG